MIKAIHKEWKIIKYGKSLQEIADKLGCSVSDFEVLVTYSETDWILRDVPEEFRSRLSYMAYERGHSAGESEITLILEELVSNLLPCIKAFEERLTKSR